MTQPFINSKDYPLVGDGVTNDYTAMQNFLADIGSIGGTGFLAPGKYFISGGDPTLSIGIGIPALKLSAHGARIITDPTQARTALTIQHVTGVDHNDGPRKVIIEGLDIDQFDNPGAIYGIRIIKSFHVVLRDSFITAGANYNVTPNPNYQAISLEQSDPHNGGTASYWTRIENVNVVGGANKVPAGIVLYGQDNATSINKCDFSYTGNAILLYADSDGNIANSIRILDNDFEAVDQCIMFASPIAGVTTCEGLVAAYNRVESCSTFFYYRLNRNGGTPPVIGPNMIMSTTTPIYNPNNLTITRY